MLYAVWYHLYNIKKREKQPQRSATFSIAILHGCFSGFQVSFMHFGSKSLLGYECLGMNQMCTYFFLKQRSKQAFKVIYFKQHCNTAKRIIILYHINVITAQKLKFSITDFFSKFDQIRSFLRIWWVTLTEEILNGKLHVLSSGRKC